MNHKINQVLTLVLTIAALMVGQSAWAESTWTVTNDNGNSNTFTIKRSETGYAQTVHFRTISLSAYAGQHFTAVDMDYTFPADEDTKTVTVSEKTPSGAYVYQTADSRKYGFEVTDRGGFQLAYAERSKTWGTSVTGSGIFGVKSINVGSGETTVTDDGYINNPYRTMAGSDYYDNAAPKAWLSAIGATLHMTLSMKVKEVNDGYQYIQVLFDNTSSCDDRSNCSDGNPGNINLSRYMAGFGHHPGSYDGNWSTYTFPVTSQGNNCGTVSNPWSNTIDAKLYDQKFRYDSYRDTDGKLIIPTEFTTLVLRLNASGNNEDNWTCKDVTANIQAIDGTNPTKIAVSVNPGRHAKGNTVYVSVAFSEIVTVTGTPTLTTTTNNNWGSLTYVDGSGTNVLTFSTTIPQNATGNLNITGLSGTVKDLAGNDLSGSVTASGLCTLDGDLAYAIVDFQAGSKDNEYLITSRDDLRGLAGYVNGGNNCSGKTFLQVADIVFPYTNAWNVANSENNFTAIGNNNNPFQGTFDGQGYTVSGMRIYKGGTGNSDDNQGLFGYVGSGGTVKRVNLANVRITAKNNAGGIVGKTYQSTIEDCIVGTDVCIYARQPNSYYHGGIVGYNQATVQRCISRASLTIRESLSSCKDFGGVVGYNNGSNGGTITDCIADGAIIRYVNGRGAIVGFNNGTLTRNYYHACTVAGVVNATGVGQGTSESSGETSDIATDQGALPVFSVTLPEHVSIVRTPATDPTLPGTDNATYTTGADIDGQSYAYATAALRLSYDAASLPSGYDLSSITVKYTSGGTVVDVTSNGDYTFDFTMPATDVTVTATILPVISYIDANGVEQSHMCTPITTSKTIYGNSANAEGWYCVNSDVDFNNNDIKLQDQQVNIILCDGATLTTDVASQPAFNASNGSLIIYGQSFGTGTLTIKSRDNNAIAANDNIDINGGTINATSIFLRAIFTEKNITIRRGIITAHGQYNNGIRGIKANTITLGCATAVDRISAYKYEGTVIIADGQILSDGTATYSGTLSNEQIAAIAGKTLSTAIPYIDADGTTKYKASKDVTFIKSSTSNSIYYGNAANAEGWYVVNSDVAFSYDVKFQDQAVHVILCDGATLTCETIGDYDLIRANNGSLAIYGQTHGSGTLSVTGNYDGKAIFAYSNIDFNGGTIKATSNGNATAIAANGNITIRRGNITAKAKTSSDGISATTITLGCATTADHIYATSYNGTVTIADGQTLTDGNSANTYTNTLNDEQKAAIAGKTMMKALGDVSYIDENGDEQTCSNYIILSDGILTKTTHDIGQTSQDTWYVASGSYTYNTGYFQTRGHVHLILCDGANFTVNASGNWGVYTNDNLSIYGQSQGTGTLTANVTNASGNALYFLYGNLFINGGIINANGGEYGIYVKNGSMTVNGGSINATGTTSGIYVRDNLTLGWNKLSDRITANSYSCTGTISVKEGQQLHNGSSLLSGTLYNHNGGNPTGDLSVLAGLTLKPAVPYIAADGTTQYCTDFTVIETSNSNVNLGTSGETHWYVVSGDVTISGQLQFENSHSHLIVCDGATLTVSSPDGYDAIRGKDDGDGITIYGQTQQSGTVNATSSSDAIYARGPVTINGGIINATGYDGIFVGIYGITINGGSITATGSGYGISGTNVTINGGTVSATGSDYGIEADETITLGWTNATDRIYANSYSKNPVVKSGQTFTDGTNAYSGSVNKSNIAGQTLQPCYSITLPAHVIATGVISQNGTTAYALPAADITLSAEANFALANVEVNGTAATDNGDGTWSFTMPAEDVTVTATVSVPYIDADGTTQYCASYTLIQSSQYNVSLGNINNDEAWYVAPAGEVTISGKLYISGKAVHLILCDGAELTVTESSFLDAVSCPYSLTIYGQSAQSGRLTATATGSTGCGIKADEGDITVNGGIISATSNNSMGIWARNFSSGNGNVTINRGSVTATSNGGSSSYGIYANNNVTINGGIVSATGNSDGIYASGSTITLGWTNATDRIYANSYNKNPVVKSGQTFTDGNALYRGTLNSTQIEALAGQTLQPAVALAMNGAGIMTYASPYALDLSNVNAYVVSSFNSGNSTLTLSKVTEAPANTGLLLKAKDGQKGTTVALPLKASAEAIASNMLVGVLSDATVVPQTDGSKTNFILANGKYGIDWYTLSEDGAIGANKAYLQLLTADLTNLAREFTWVYDDGETTEMNEELRMKNEEFNATGWYTLEGRKLDGKPTTKGLYIHNGRKVLLP